VPEMTRLVLLIIFMMITPSSTGERRCRCPRRTGSGDPEDDAVLSAAVEGRAAVIVNGDDDLLPWRSTRVSRS